MNAEPQPEIDQPRANAVVKLLTGDTHFIMETPHEVRAKRAELRENVDLGLGDGEDGNGGLLVLAGLDVFAGDPPDVEAFDLSVHPGMIGMVRGITDRYWKAHLELASTAPDPTPMPGPGGPSPGNPLGKMLSDMGFQVLGGGGFPMQGLEHGTKPRSIKNASPDEICCCGHRADSHLFGEEFVGDCHAEGCTCGLFHTHDGEK